MPRFHAAAALAGLACALAVAPAAVAVVSHPSTVTIHYGPVAKAFTNQFYGRVKSPKAACVPGRSVRVFHVQPGPDSPQGMPPAETNAKGRWEIGNDIAHGRYYVKVKPSLIGNQVCKRSRSDIIHVG
jgi:hypothetical protein